MKNAVVTYGIIFLFAAPLSARAADAPTANDLMGKWSGEPPMGGELEINVTSVEGGKIKGTGNIPGRGARSESPEVSGEVKGKRVIIETRFERGATVTYRCEFTKKDEMPCTMGGGKKTTFVRVKQ
jgi:hypothetical protein